ncbi:MAG: dethiobiotin synthase [Cytophagales bacterium]|nr:MAG: dethiobiotin synthase [Cytophagales bacterium]
MKLEKYFVTAIGTDSGKTVVSAILTQALQADYWKPVQCGSPKDADTILELTNSGYSLIHPEAYFLKAPMSPHAAAKLEDIRIDIDKINIPDTQSNRLVIEGAGGVLVPLNEQHFVIDLVAKFDAPLVLVCNLYLGSINHSLLTINEIKRRGLKVKGIIFNGEENLQSESFILDYSGYKCLLRLRPTAKVNQEFIQQQAIQLFQNWDER